MADLIRDALQIGRDYVYEWVKNDGGIDHCDIEFRTDLEKIDAAIAALPAQGVNNARIAGWVRRLRNTEEAGRAHHLSKSDRLAIADFLAALPAQGVRVNEAAVRVRAMIEADPASKLFGVPTDDLRAILAALEIAETGGVEAQPADDMLAIMLSLIDSAMSCTNEKPAVLRITPHELATWADAVQKYEEARFPMHNGDDQ